MLLSLAVFVPTVASAATNTDATPESTKNALELFGFPLDPDSYDTQALKTGTYPMSPKYDLYADDYSQIRKYTGSKVANSAGSLYTQITKTPTNYTNTNKTPYSAVTGFAASGTGVEDYIAKAYFSYGRQGANIYLSIYNSNGSSVVSGFNTGGYVITTDQIEMWEVEGLLSITAGDFDGDGYDEIAVYTPNNANETSNGSVHSNISIGIFEFDKTTKKIITKQYLDLPSKSSTNEICEWEYSHNGASKQFYCLPYVAMSANDLNNDGIDDLSAIVNFSTWYRGAGEYDTYTTAKILNHNTCFASVLESYEGTRSGNLKQVIKHRVLATTPLKGGSSDANAEHRYILRNANITVGDVTKEGSQEIIIAGNYTRVGVRNVADNTNKVGNNRMAEVDENNALCHIVGYTTYDNLKNHNTYDANSEYHWTVQKEGNGWTYWYNSDKTDSGPITTSLCAYKHKGTGKPDTIFVGGQLFEYNGEEGKLKFLYNYNGDGQLYHGTNGKKRKTSVVWIGGAVAGNFSDDVFGREVLIFPFYLKVSGEQQFTCKLLTFGELTANQANGGNISSVSQTRYCFEDSSTERLVSLALVDSGGKTGYITYPGNDTEVYYSDVEVLSILQAPPVYEELKDDDYVGNSATSFERSESTSDGKTSGGSFTAGPVVGLEYKANFLGIFPVAGSEYEFSLCGSVSHEKSTEKTFSYATGFETTGTTDAVTVFTVPHVRYNCYMYMPEYKTPVKDDYLTMCAFRDELTKNLENCLKTGNEQITGTYVKGCKYYEYKYSSYVTSDNYQDQLTVLKKVTDEISFIEDGIAEFGNGGTANWGQTVKAAVIPYTYSVPQTPLLTTVSVETYDSIAEFTPGLEKIYGNVFPDYYRPGDPNTYAKNVGQLNATDNVLQGKAVGTSSTDGYISNSHLTAGGVSATQTISVEESESSSIGWGVAIENTSIATLSVAKVGFTASLEHSTSYVTTKTEGHEYSATQVAMPDYVEDAPYYGYDWKLVSYTTQLNGSKVPVVGYLVKNVKTPPTVAQDIEVKDITESSATITWKDGSRPADYYKLDTVYVANDGKEYTANIATNITSENGSYSYTLKNLKPNETNYYVLQSYMNDGKHSVPTQDRIIITTFPKDFSASINVSGFDEGVIYRNGKAFNISTNVTTSDDYNVLYQWQINNGNGWKDIPGQNAKDFKFTISPLDNGKQVRCTAVVVISGASSYILRSEPMTMNCARSDGDYEVDWEDNKLIVTTADGGESVTAFVRVIDSEGKVVTIVDVNGEADLSEYLNKGYDLRLFLLKNNLSPASLPFER